MRSNLNLFLILIILTISLLPVQASSEQTEYEYYFGLYTLNENTIEKYGTLSFIETAEQKEEWQETLRFFSSEIKDEFASQYMYPNGDVFTCGSSSEGYFVVLYRGETVEKQNMDELYTFLSSAAENMNIQSIPVEFGYGLYIQDRNSRVEDLDYITEEYMKSGDNIHTAYHVYNRSDMITSYGEVPEFNSLEEWADWYDELGIITNEVGKAIFEDDEISQTGWITGLGPSVSGELEIGIYGSLTDGEKLLLTTQIYDICDQEANKRNITNVAVAFYNADYEVEDESLESEIEDSSESSPGFSALTLLLVTMLAIVLGKDH